MCGCTRVSRNSHITWTCCSYRRHVCYVVRFLIGKVVDMLCKLPVKGITRERIHLALAHKGYKKKGEFEHELRVVYELIQGNKLHKERLKVHCWLQPTSAQQKNRRAWVIQLLFQAANGACSFLHSRRVNLMENRCSGEFLLQLFQHMSSISRTLCS